ncbi:hypothetical protein [Clostridium gasigenes]|uniref:hypothetical protein n=1 Tax=Clostridium gasigenes TaxID=94869 RepID=UPI001C0C09CA|nr:hypothetical protein [Clostridium gasigenes]MBU3105069.1 hypothetical protein [Clostridium gasigenes]
MHQERYYSEVIEDDKQMLETSISVYLKPVKAKMVEKDSEYRWSNYKMFIGKFRH